MKSGHSFRNVSQSPDSGCPAAPPRSARLYRSSVGKKAVMAVTGAVLVLFLVGHMAGNLKIFLGRAAFDHYAHWLRTIGEPAIPHRVFLSAMEAVLVVAVALHMWSAVSLARRARRARPVRYAARPRAREGRYATHVMRYGGVVILLFVVWHLLDLTFGAVNPKGGERAAVRQGRRRLRPRALVHHGLLRRRRGHGRPAPAARAVERVPEPRPGPAAAAVACGSSPARSSALLVAGFVSVPLLVTIGVVR